MTENKLCELAELLAELEQTLLRLKVTKDLERRRLLLCLQKSNAALSRRNESLPDGGYGRGGDVPWQMSGNPEIRTNSEACLSMLLDAGDLPHLLP